MENGLKIGQPKIQNKLVMVGGDCQYEERCQLAYCVPDSCQKNVDCPDVGHIIPGLIQSKGCDKGTCTANPFPVMKTGISL